MPGKPRWHLPKHLTTDERIAFYTQAGPNCHIWIGPIKRNVNGDIRPILGHNYKRINVARYVLQRKLSRAIRDGYEAAHTCNNTLCINDEHLYEATHLENMQDRVYPRGDDSPLATHVQEEFDAVKKLVAAGYSDEDVSFLTTYAVSSVQKIRLGLYGARQ